MNPNVMTVKELLELCQQAVKNGKGDKAIMIPQDDECNGYHYLWKADFYNVEEAYAQDDMSENVASEEETVILTY